MSDEKRTASEQLKHRIVQDTFGQVGVAAKAMFDAFTGGHEAVLDSVAEDFEAKQRGEKGVPMRARYRCSDCGDVHWEGTSCLPTHAPPRVTSPADTERAPPPSNGAPAVDRGIALPAKSVAEREEATHTILFVCAECLKDGEDAKRTTWGEALCTCERCMAPQISGKAAFMVPR
jgi:hypothetical protein